MIISILPYIMCQHRFDAVLLMHHDLGFRLTNCFFFVTSRKQTSVQSHANKCIIPSFNLETMRIVTC